MKPDAGQFLRARPLNRLMAEVRRKFASHGVGGIAELHHPTPEEKAAIAKLMGHRWRNPPPGRPLRVSLRKLAKVFEAPPLSCALQEALSQYFGEPVRSRAEERETARQEWERFVASLANGVAPGVTCSQHDAAHGTATDHHPRCQHWLKALAQMDRHTAYVHRSFQRQGEVAARRMAEVVLAALATLPGPYDTEQLAVFANRVAGDPHAFDDGTPTGIVLIRALEAEFGAAAGIPRARGREETDRLLEAAGLVRDTISSFTTVSGLHSAVSESGAPDDVVQAAAGRPHLYTLAEVSQWQAVTTSPVVYVVENPVVFEALVAQQPSVTLICTRGFPSLASMSLLHLVSQCGARLWYSGDFDPNGLIIARSLLERFGEQCKTWRMAENDYVTALERSPGRPLSQADAKRLQDLEQWFPALSRTMQDRLLAAFQEGLIPELTRDLTEQ